MYKKANRQNKRLFGRAHSVTILPVKPWNNNNNNKTHMDGRQNRGCCHLGIFTGVSCAFTVISDVFVK